MLNIGPISAPAGVSACHAEIKKATATEFVLVNPAKQSNFILGELVSGGQLSFIIENLPKTTPYSGCPGKWMFQQMMAHFGSTVTAIQGNWIGPASDNLTAINKLTAGGTMTIEAAAKQTWTGIRATEFGFTQVEVIGCQLERQGNIPEYTSCSRNRGAVCHIR